MKNKEKGIIVFLLVGFTAVAGAIAFHLKDSKNYKERMEKWIHQHLY